VEGCARVRSQRMCSASAGHTANPNLTLMDMRVAMRQVAGEGVGTGASAVGTCEIGRLLTAGKSNPSGEECDRQSPPPAAEGNEEKNLKNVSLTDTFSSLPRFLRRPPGVHERTPWGGCELARW
jgi:hypothetical protein